MTDTGTVAGIVTCVHPSHYEVTTDGGTYRCYLRGRLKEDEHESERTEVRPAAAGDRVEISIAEDEEGAIEEIKERRNKISRPAPEQSHREQVIAVNVDCLIAVQAVRQPALTPDLLDQCLAAGEHFDIPEIAVCLNKIDLLDPDEDPVSSLPDYPDIGYRLFQVSAREETNIEPLRAFMRKNISVLVGPSGVGKSSLLNVLSPGLNLETGKIGRKSGRGTHRTTTMRLHEIEEETYCIDTPGVDMLSLWEADYEQVPFYFPEIRETGRKCQFNDCLHQNEPGCAVREATEEPEGVHPQRYRSYVKLLEKLKGEQSYTDM